MIDGVPGKGTTRDTVESTNASPIDFLIDLSNKSFAISGAPFTFADGTATLTVAGTVVNQPPVANAGSPQTVECTSPTGGNVVLDATGSSDPDNDIGGMQWWVGHAFSSTGLVDTASNALATRAEFVAPFVPPSLTTFYELSVFDSRFDTSIAKTSVTVQDTIPPTLTVSALPDCLWLPSHKMVLYELGKSLTYTVKDPCDLHPVVSIIDVKSNQPATGGGSGNTNTDVAFGAGGLCIRAERDGTVSTDRQYTITVQAL